MGPIMKTTSHPMPRYTTAETQRGRYVQNASVDTPAAASAHTTANSHQPPAVAQGDERERRVRARDEQVDRRVVEHL